MYDLLIPKRKKKKHMTILYGNYAYKKEKEIYVIPLFCKNIKMGLELK